MHKTKTKSHSLSSPPFSFRGMDDVVSSIIDLTAAHPEMPLQVSVPFLYLEAKVYNTLWNII